MRQAVHNKEAKYFSSGVKPPLAHKKTASGKLWDASQYAAFLWEGEVANDIGRNSNFNFG